MTALLIVMFALMLAGVPVALSIGVSGAAFLLFFESVPVAAIAQRMVVGVDSFTLLAIPLFVLAGTLMARGDITPKIMRLASLLVGRLHGGLACVLVVSCMLFGAISGSGIADVAAIGSIVVPMMREQKYSMPFTASLLGCAGSLGTIIPPSIVMVVLGVTMGVSIGRLFLAGIVPGLLLGAGLMVGSWFVARRENYPRGSRLRAPEVWAALREAVLPMGAPLIIVVGFRGGVFTATETGAVAALYALLLAAFVYRKISLRDFLDVCYETALTSASVLLIIAAASLFGWILALEEVPRRVAEGVLSATEGLANPYWTVLLLFNLMLLVLGTFMESIAIVIITVPVFMPMMTRLGVDPIHLGVMIAVNLAIGANSPPLGVDLMTACKIADVPYASSFRYIFPFLGIMTLVLLAVIFFPSLSTWVPNAMMGGR
ncbi:MAG: TRAP transporter large permease [Synergistaceae bacterium]|jgi:tripartite ATP-independent transporter DctM subunit|nr:TRAP transporter large permease [Synergistaceae bacterium]